MQWQPPVCARYYIYFTSNPLTCLRSSVDIPISQRRKLRLREEERLAQVLAPPAQLQAALSCLLRALLFLHPARSPVAPAATRGGALQQPPLSPQSPWGLLPLPSLPQLPSASQPGWSPESPGGLETIPTVRLVCDADAVGLTARESGWGFCCLVRFGNHCKLRRGIGQYYFPANSGAR